MLCINRYASRVRFSIGDGLRLIPTLDNHSTDSSIMHLRSCVNLIDSLEFIVKKKSTPVTLVVTTVGTIVREGR